MLNLARKTGREAGVDQYMVLKVRGINQLCGVEMEAL